jgi:hypothetical protein
MRADNEGGFWLVLGSAALGGTGNGLSQVSKLSNNTVSRIYRAEKHNGIKSGIKEVGNAMAYNGKSTNRFYSSYLKRTTPKDLGTSVVFGAVASAIRENNLVVNRFLNRVYER